MKIWILSSSSQTDSTSLFTKSAKKSRIQAQVIDPSHLHFEFSPKGYLLYHRQRKVSLPDAVLPRFGWKTLGYGLRLCHFFEAAGVPVINSTQSLRIASDKLSSLMEFKAHGLKIPATRFAISTLETEAHLFSGDKPTVFKLLKGSQGFGVTLTETRAQARAQVDAYRNIPTEFLLQEFLAESRGTDVRAFVIGGRVVASMERSAAPGEFRSNLHQGGSAEKTVLNKKETELVIQASKALGLFYAGVDFVRTKKGPILLEANPFPGLDGITETTGVDVASIFFEKLKAKLK